MPLKCVTKSPNSPHYLLTIYSPSPHHLLTIYSLSTHYLLTIYSLSTYLLTAYLSLSTHYLFTIYSLSTHYLLTIYSLSTHCVPVCDVVDPAADGCLLPNLHRLVLQTSQWHRLLIRGGSMKGFWRLYKPVRSTGQCGGCRYAAAWPPRAPGPRPELRRCRALWRQEQTWRRCLTMSGIEIELK